MEGRNIDWEEYQLGGISTGRSKDYGREEYRLGGISTGRSKGGRTIGGRTIGKTPFVERLEIERTFSRYRDHVTVLSLLSSELSVPSHFAPSFSS